MKPVVDNRDMCGALSIICSALITNLMCRDGMIAYINLFQFIMTIAAFIFFISIALFWITQKIVCIANKKAKRKATDKVSSKSNNTIK